MLIQCPQCRSLIDDSEHAAEPPVDHIRCPHCDTSFNRRYAVSAGDPQPPAKPPPRIQVPREALLAEAEAAVPGNRRSAAWGAANLLLIAVLLLQVSYIQREALARYAPLRPWLEVLCRYAGCALPLQRAPERIRILARDVSRHPAAAGALVVTVTFVNDAGFTQPYPDLELSFFDLGHRVLARRRFTPEQYLPAGIDAERGMPPGKPTMSTLEIVDPGKEAINFELAFF